MKISSLSKKRTSLLLLCSLGLGLSVTAQKKKKPKPKTETKSKVYKNKEIQVKKANTTFELFQDKSSSDGEMTVIYVEETERKNGKNVKSQKAGSGRLKGKWSSIGNTLIRESQRPSNTKTNMKYSVNLRKMEGNAYYGGYGWWSTKKNGKNTNIVEFYVTDGYNDKTNATFGMTKSSLSYKVDGENYDVYYSEKKGLGSVFSPSSNFLQIKAVRRKSKGSKGKKEGNITWKTHFDKWRSFGNTESKRKLPQNLVEQRKDSKRQKADKKKKRDAFNRKKRSLSKFIPRSIFEISWLMEGFGTSGSFSRVDFDANATFKSSSKKELSLEKVSNLEATVYPNPTSGEFTVTMDSDSETTVTIFDLNGKLVSETITDTSEILLNSDNSLTSGLYIVRVTNAEGTTTQKLVVN